MKASKVIVPIGLPRQAEKVLAVASEMSGVIGAPIEMVHVVGSLDADPAVERRRAWMAPLAERHAATLRLVEHESIATGLQDVIADHPDAVVCMHVDASGGPLDVALGSLSEAVLRAGHHRCVLIGPDVSTSASISSGPVVVCVDGSDHSASILTDAAEWAKATGRAIWVVVVISGNEQPTDVGESAYVQKTARSLGVRDVEWEVLHGDDPARAIIQFAELRNAGTIVMATHGRSGVGRLALGSTTVRVVHGAPCPVIARRPPLRTTVLSSADTERR